jgi:hypothetical protein
MSRVGAADVVLIKPQNNVYTVMVIVATVVQLLAFMVVFFRFHTEFGVFLFNS